MKMNGLLFHKIQLNYESILGFKIKKLIFFKYVFSLTKSQRP